MFVDKQINGDILDHLSILSSDYLARILPTHGFKPNSIQPSISALKSENRSQFIETRQQDLIIGERVYATKKN